MRNIIRLWSGVLVMLSCAAVAAAGQTVWTWGYSPAAGETPSAAVTPVKYGKAWAYTVEIDDAPATTLAFAMPLLAGYHWTDAPPGVAGGTEHPIVGGASVYALRVEGNGTYLSWAQVATLRSNGWGVLNHSYWHSGYGWDPAGYLTEAELRRELFWSQQIIGMKTYGDRAPIHFVYPNGYTAYGTYLTQYDLYSGSRVSGSSTRVMTSPSFNPLDMTRTYLDESNWTGSGGSNPMYQFPAGGPADDELFIDFTHNIEGPGTANHTRWQTRLTTIAGSYGAGGSDEFWSAPTNEVIAYHTLADAADVQLAGGQLTVTVPDDLPGSALTVRLDGVDPSSTMTAPEGGLLYRSGTTVWITTPTLNDIGAPLPNDDIVLAHCLPFASHIDLPAALRVAAIRILSQGTIPEAYYPTITLHKADGSSQVLPVQHILDQQELGSGWGKWYLFPTLPDSPAIEGVVGVDIADCLAFKQVEIYAVGPLPQGPCIAHDRADLGGGLSGWTFRIANDDGLLMPYTVEMGFEGAGGATIQQVQYNGVMPIHTETMANIADGGGTPPYSKDYDTWVFTPFCDNTIPGTNPLTGGALTGFYEAANAFAFSCWSGSGSTLGDNVNLAYVVADGNVEWTGTIVRNGFDYQTAGVTDLVVALPGDYNGDGAVSGADYVVWADTFGNDGSPGKEDLRADGNGDGLVSGSDYVVWANNFGASSP